MQRDLRLAGMLVIGVLLLPAGLARAQFSATGGGYLASLARYDRNGNGLLEAHERAAMLAAAQDPEPVSLAALPLVCEGKVSGGSGGEVASATGSHQDEPQPQVAPGLRLLNRQFAESQPQDGDQVAQQAEASPDDYVSGPPPSTPPQPVQFRRAVQYRMMLNEQRAQPRSQPFAQAATFGPMVGRVKQYPRRSFTVSVHSRCACSRASLYFAGY